MSDDTATRELSDEELVSIAASARRFGRDCLSADARGELSRHPEILALSRENGFATYAYAQGIIAERLRSLARIAELERQARNLARCLGRRLEHESYYASGDGDVERVVLSEARAAGLLDGER